MYHDAGDTNSHVSAYDDVENLRKTLHQKLIHFRRKVSKHYPVLVSFKKP